MNTDGDISRFEAVAQFVAEETGVRRNRINAESRLREDLHVDGDDAWDLLIAFAKKFHVRDTTLDFADHFGPEASGPLALMFRCKKLLPMTIQDLVDSATTGVWQVSSTPKPTANC